MQRRKNDFVFLGKKTMGLYIMAGREIFHVVECYETNLIKNENLESEMIIHFFFIIS